MEAEVVIVGAGAAGIAAGRILHDAGVRIVVLEARARLGGRAWTVRSSSGTPIDLGCDWLHSADRNPWVEVAQSQGLVIDRNPAPWTRPAFPVGFEIAEQKAFSEALSAYHDRLESTGESETDFPAGAFLEPGDRWNELINAVCTYVSGAEADRLSVKDLSRYDDTGVNWRIPEGYGRAIATHAANLPVVLNCPVLRVDRSGRNLKLQTAEGTVLARTAIVTLPSAILAETPNFFAPALPDKADAAAGLPLGLADKLFLSLEAAEEFEKETRLFGRIDRAGTGTYHFRPFGRPEVEVYFAGTLAAELEARPITAFFDFAVSELTALLGSDFSRRAAPIGLHRWGSDPYSALPGKAECRATLVEPVEERIFFAGEACSPRDFSTAHGAYLTGVAAAMQALLTIRRK